MPDDLYERDILTWSEQQADLLSRIARGERVNGVDWPHIVEEIADLGLSELNGVRSLLRQGMIHLLKIHLWPDDMSELHWRTELVAFLADASGRYAPSMRQRIDVEELYTRSSRGVIQIAAARGLVPVLPGQCPWTLEQLLEGDACVLLDALPSHPSQSTR